jgi:beta-glucosidase
LYQFGFGLSYTTFAYRNLKLPAQAKTGESVKVAVEVANTGKMAGDEVVQVYVRAPQAGGPIHSLAGFERIALGPGQKKTVQFELAPRQFSRVESNGRRRVEPGDFDVSIGGSQRAALTKIVRLTGAAKEID